MTFARSLVFASLLLLPTLLATRASAQCVPSCSTTERCVSDPSSGDTRCVPARGQCLVHPERCFAPGDTAAERFANGDCDGDLIPNTLDGAALCDGATVITFEGVFRAVPGSRLDDPGATMISPVASTIVPDAFAVGCSAARECPPVDAMDVRCVYLPVVPAMTPPVGACLYYYPLADDLSCVETGALTDGSQCFDYVGYTIPYDAWAHGDCDLDGLINKQDGPVCRANEVIGVTPDGLTAACQPADFSTARCDEAGMTRTHVGPELSACGTDALVPFAVCCDSSADCPAHPTPGAAFPRCVRVLTSLGRRGACVYDGVRRPDDDSCAGSAADFVADCALTDPSYDVWAEGDCDHCEDVNRMDLDVCSCAMGEDAGVRVEEAGVSVDEAGVPVDEVGLPDLDASGPDSGVDTPLDTGASGPPGSFAGSGCRCVVGTRSPPGLAWAGLLGLLALVVYRRSASRALS